ncbi:hypothetical protein KKI24_27480, partial [bacterium]|nr:hypothetical protein [bacterium]
MARLFYYGTIILAVVGLGVSWLIFPGEDELAFLQYKDQYYSKALVLYEMEASKGNLSPQVVSPLADLYLKYGYIDKAISLMEAFVNRNPRNTSALEKLGLYYQYAQRYDDYRRNLEAIYRVSPKPEILRQLSEIYNSKGDLDRQRTVLEELTRRFPADKQDYIDLAYLYAAGRDYLTAVEVLDRFLKRSDTPDPEIVELMISLLIDAGQPRKAFELASSALRSGDTNAALRYASLLNTRGNNELAYQLLQPYQQQSAKNPRILRELVALEIALNRKESAIARLTGFFDRNQLPVELLDTLLPLLLELKDLPRLRKVVKTAQLDLINQAQLAALVDIYQQNNDKEMLAVLNHRLSPELRSEFPVIDIRLTLATHPENIKAAAVAVRNRPWLTDEQRLLLAQAYSAGDLDDEARGMLSDVRTIAQTTAIDPYTISSLYIKHGLAEKGLSLFDAESRVQDQPDKERQQQLEVNAIMLAMAAGKEKRVMAYLQGPGPPDRQPLIDLYYAAVSLNNTAVMLETSRLLMADKTAGKEAFIVFRVEALLAAKQYADALPYLRQLIRDNDPNWIYTYADVLEKLGRWSEWAALQVQQSGKADLSRTEKRSIAYALLEKGYWVEAQVIFFQLAQSQGPDDPDVDQLVFLWEAHPGNNGLAWLRNRIDKADRSSRNRWVEKFYRLAMTQKQEQQIERLASQHPELLSELTRLEIENGRREEAYARFIRLKKENRLLPVSLLALVHFAVDYRNKPLLKQLVLESKLDGIEPGVLIRLFDLVLDSLSPDDIRPYRDALGEPFFTNHRVIDLMFDVAEKQTIQPGRFDDITRDPAIVSRDRLILAGFLLKRGLKNESERMITGIIDLKGLSEDELFQVADLYLQIGRPEAGLQLFDQQSGIIQDQV